MLVVGALGERGLLGTGFGIVLGARVERVEADAVVDGDLREYLLHVPRSARRIWGDRAPVVFVWPGNSQTAKVFLDATRAGGAELPG